MVKCEGKTKGWSVRWTVKGGGDVKGEGEVKCGGTGEVKGQG